MDYSIVIPVYNSQRSLPLLIRRLTAVMKIIGSSYEIILVDDGSTDNTWSVLVKQKKETPHLRIIRFLHNFGQHNAILAGLRYSKGKLVITLDDDLQNPPEEIPKLIKAISTRNVDVVIGAAFSKQHSFIRNIGSMIIDKFFCIILKKPAALRLGNMYCIKRSVVNAIIKETTPNPILAALVLTHTRNAINISVRHEKRAYGSSMYTWAKLISLSYDLIINYSTIPLRVMSVIGVMTFIFGCIAGVYVGIRTIFYGAGLPGWASLITILLLFCGLTLFSFSVTGEYLTRILREVSRVKQYVISEEKL